MLTNNDYCDYETCVALVELGMRITSRKVYSDRDTLKHSSRGVTYTVRTASAMGWVIAIPLYSAQKWLREEKDIHIEVYACAGGYIYELCKAYKSNSFSGGTTIYTPNDVDNPKLNDAGRYDDFETCLSEGIKEAVKILKGE